MKKFIKIIFLFSIFISMVTLSVSFNREGIVQASFLSSSKVTDLNKQSDISNKIDTNDFKKEVSKTVVPESQLLKTDDIRNTNFIKKDFIDLSQKRTEVSISNFNSNLGGVYKTNFVSTDANKINSLVVQNINNDKQKTVILPEKSLETLSCPNDTTDIYGKKDMHVWHTADIKAILTGGQLRDDLLSFLDTHAIGRIYLSLPSSLLKNPTYKTPLMNFLNILKNEHCVSVRALGGSIEWVATPNSSTTFTIQGLNYTTMAAINWVNAVKEFNNSVPSDGTRLEGLQVDVEPWSLTCNTLTGGSSCSYPGWSPVWNTNTNAVANAYLDMLNQMTIVAGSDLPVNADIPYWFDVSEKWPTDSAHFNRIGYGVGKSLAEWVIRATNSVTIMDYFTDPNKIYSHAVGELEYAKSIGKTLKIGLNTSNTVNGSANSSFSSKTCGDLTNALGSSYNLISANNLIDGFGGFSIHMWRANVSNPDPADRAYWDLCR